MTDNSEPMPLLKLALEQKRLRDLVYVLDHDGNQLKVYLPPNPVMGRTQHKNWPPGADFPPKVPICLRNIGQVLFEDTVYMLQLESRWEQNPKRNTYYFALDERGHKGTQSDNINLKRIAPEEIERVRSSGKKIESLVPYLHPASVAFMQSFLGDFDLNRYQQEIPQPTPALLKQITYKPPPAA